MEQITEIESLAGVIQLSVAPVFLLAGIAGLLNVLSIRLGRVVDRVRIIEIRLARETHEGHRTILQSEAAGLWKRVRLVNWSLRVFVSGALLVCMVIVFLFVAELASLDLSILVASSFVGAMCLLITGLILFLFEVSISTSRIREGIVEIIHEEHGEGESAE